MQAMSDTHPQANVPKMPEPLLKRIFSWMKDKFFAGLLLLILGGIMTWIWSRSPDVRYSIGAVSARNKESGSADVMVTNKGSLSAEDVDCEIKMADGEIKDIQFSPSIFKAIVTIDPDQKRANINIPRLNSREHITLTVTATHQIHIPRTLSVQVRGKDIPISEDNSSKTSLFGTFIMTAVGLVGLAGMFASSVASEVRTKLKAIKVFHFHNGPMAGRFITGSDAKELYRKLDDTDSKLEMGDTTYYTWESRKWGSTIIFVMVCNDGVPIASPILAEMSESHQPLSGHLL